MCVTQQAGGGKDFNFGISFLKNCQTVKPISERGHLCGGNDALL